jgi:hypothetical protein
MFHRAGLAMLRASAVATVLLSVGCMSTRYKMAPPTMPPAIVLNLAADQPALAGVVHSVIIFQGPGSWKQAAYWDEYVVTLINRGSAPLVVDGASLQGLADELQQAGDHPWKIEKASRTAAAYNFGLAKNVAVQMGGGLGTVVAAGVIGGLIAPAGFIIPAGLGVGVLVAVPAVIGGTIYRNITGRHKIEAEFQRRRLALPLTLAPGATAQGSLFFRITPGPRRLSLTYASDGRTATLPIELTSLGGLHLKDAAPAR